MPRKLILKGNLSLRYSKNRVDPSRLFACALACLLYRPTQQRVKRIDERRGSFSLQTANAIDRFIEIELSRRIQSSYVIKGRCPWETFS